jgi:predicted nucleic acid-binding protein
VLAAERRAGLAASISAAFLGLVETLPIEQDAVRPAARLGAVMALARACQLSSYDATYLELALRCGATLATFDRKLAEAARGAGVKVLGDGA